MNTPELMQFLLESQWPAGSLLSGGTGVGSFAGGPFIPFPDFNRSSPTSPDILSLLLSQQLRQNAAGPSPTAAPTPMPQAEAGDADQRQRMDHLQSLTEAFQNLSAMRAAGIATPFHEYFQSRLGYNTRQKMADILQRYGVRPGADPGQEQR